MKYLLVQTNTVFFAKNTEGKKLSISVAQHLARSGIDKYELAKKLGYEPIICNACGTYNPHMKFIARIEGEKCFIEGIRYYWGKSIAEEPYCYSKNKSCSTRGLNANSAKFVSLVYKLSESDAIKLIHERNSTPFYECNHSSKDEYLVSQSRLPEWFIDNNKSRDEWIAKANHSRSREGLQKKYGVELGDLKYDAICEAKLNSLEQFLIRHGDGGYDRFKSYLSSCAMVGKLEDYITVYGNKILGTKAYIRKTSSQHKCGTIEDIDSLIKHCINLVKKTPLHVCDGFPLEKHILSSNAVRRSIGIYVDSVNDLVTMVLDAAPEIHSEKRIRISRMQNGCFRSWFSYTNEGILLRSSFEAEFYLALLKNDITNIQISKRYPTTNFISDFYFPEIDLYVEVCGMMGVLAYDVVIELKKALPYNIKFCYDKKNIDELVSYIKGKINGL